MAFFERFERKKNSFVLFVCLLLLFLDKRNNFYLCVESIFGPLYLTSKDIVAMQP